MPDDLYHRDIMAWSSSQADRLRRLARGERVNDLDWDNVIEEIESLGRSELKGVKAPIVRGIEHVLKRYGWPDHMAARKWRNEAVAFFGRARRELEPGMAKYIEAGSLYAQARRDVLQLDMRTPPRPLPERIALTVEDFYDPDFGPDQLLARIGAAA